MGLTLSIELLIVIYFLQIIFILIGIPILAKHFKNNLPIYTVAFLISISQIEIKILKSKFIQLLWNEILKIEVKKEKYPLTRTKYNYNLKFITLNGSIDIRLYVLRFRKKSINLIISNLETFSKINDKELFLISEIEKANYHEVKKDLVNIQDFKQKIKKKES